MLEAIVAGSRHYNNMVPFSDVKNLAMYVQWMLAHTSRPHLGVSFFEHLVSRGPP